MPAYGYELPLSELWEASPQEGRKSPRRPSSLCGRAAEVPWMCEPYQAQPSLERLGLWKDAGLTALGSSGPWEFLCRFILSVYMPTACWVLGTHLSSRRCHPMREVSSAWAVVRPSGEARSNSLEVQKRRKSSQLEASGKASCGR